MLARVLRLSIGILLIPASVGYSMAFYEQLMQIRTLETPELTLLLGITAYLAFHTLVGVPTRVYVFGHEMTHAVATWISGGQVKGFKAGPKSGSVKTSKTNGFIELAPYLIPVYSMAWALIYGALSLALDWHGLSSWFIFGLGVTLAFHLVFTVTVLKEKQSDLDGVGPVLALNLIYWTNLTLVMAVMSWMVRGIHWTVYLLRGWEYAQAYYRLIFSQIFS